MARSVTIQRGVVAVGNAGGTATPGTAFGSTSSTFVLLTNNRRMNAGLDNQSSTTLDIDDLSGGAHLASTTSIEFDREAGSRTDPMRFAWEAWEYTGIPGGPHEFIVRGRVKLTLASGSTTTSIGGVVDIDRCIPFITGIFSNSGADDADSGTAIAWMSGSGTLNVLRGSGSNNTVRVYVTVVEFVGPSWTVYHGRQEVPSPDLGTINIVTGADGLNGQVANFSSWSNGVIFHQYKNNDLNGVDDAITDTSAIYYPGGVTSQVIWEFRGDHVDSAPTGQRGVNMVHVLVNPSLTVTRYSDVQSGAGPQPINIGSAGIFDVTTVAIEVSRCSTGTGTAYGRGWTNARIVSTTSAELWVHRSGNSIKTEIQIIDLSGLSSIAVISVSDGELGVGENGVVVTGFGFGAVQGSGKVEMAADLGYTGTIVPQNVVSWSDTSITIDTTNGALPEGTLYVFVTNGAGERSNGSKVSYGFTPYDDVIRGTAPDHWWQLDNSYDDEIGSRPMDQSVVGTQTFVTPICEKNAVSVEFPTNSDKREILDTSAMNTSTIVERTMGGWVQVSSVQQKLAALYKEGGSLNNMAFLFGIGNVLMAQMADTGDDNVQAYSDIRLAINRPYHICLRYTYTQSVKEFRLYIDGVKQAVTSGNPLASSDLDSHSGDVVFGAPDTNLEMGGTDVFFKGTAGSRYAQWATWTRALSEQSEIREKLFESGALPDIVISSGSVQSMQASLDALSGTIRPDAPVAIRVEGVLGGGSFKLTANDVKFDPLCSVHVQYVGPDTLTWVNANGSNASITSSIAGGDIVIVASVRTTITVLDVVTGAAVAGARVFVEASSGGPLAQGTQLLNALTDSSGQAFFDLEYSADQPLSGRVRKAGQAPFYKTSGISGTVLSSGLSLSVFMVPD